MREEEVWMEFREGAEEERNREAKGEANTSLSVTKWMSSC